MDKNGNKTGGRKKGTPNVREFRAEDIAAKFDIDPLEVLFMIAAADWKGLQLANEDVIKLSDRANAAKELSKYLYSQKQSVALSTGDTGIRIEVVDYAGLKK